MIASGSDQGHSKRLQVTALTLKFSLWLTRDVFDLILYLKNYVIKKQAHRERSLDLMQENMIDEYSIRIGPLTSFKSLPVKTVYSV